MFKKILHWLFYLGPSAADEIAREQAIIDGNRRRFAPRPDGYEDRPTSIFCSIHGNSGNGFSAAHPTTFQKAVNMAQAGDTVYCRGGS